MGPRWCRFHGASTWLAPLALVGGNVLAFIHNALAYSSENGAQLRRHLYADTTLIPEVGTPLLVSCVPPRSAWVPRSHP